MTDHPAADGPMVLVVDDDPNIQRWAGAILGSVGCRVSHAPDVLTGIMAVRSAKPDVIVLDLHLPGGGGRVFLERLRKLPAFQRIPVLILSADLNPHTAGPLQEFGITGLLEKPVSGQLFIRSVLQAARPG